MLLNYQVIWFFWLVFSLVKCHHPFLMDIPYKALFHNSFLLHLPQYVIGCTSSEHHLTIEIDKLGPWVIECIILEYYQTHKGHKWSNPSLHLHFASVDIIFFALILIFYKENKFIEINVPTSDDFDVTNDLNDSNVIHPNESLNQYQYQLR